MQRRAFLHASSLLALGTGCLPASLRAASPTRDRVLVVIQLTGGNDGLNTVIPYADEAYYAARPTLAIPRGRVLALDDQVGFHPALAGFADLAEAGQLAVLQGVGYPNPNRSHFASMDIWHTARTSPAARSLGWLGHAADRLPDRSALPGLHLGPDTLPRALSGDRPRIASIQNLDAFRFQQDLALDPLLAPPRHAAGDLLAYIHETGQAARIASDQVRAVADRHRSQARYPATPLGQHLQTVAQLMDAGLHTRIYYLTLSGFDTHANQAGGHQALLRQLGDSTRAFLADLRTRGLLDHTLLLAFSEFGRRLRENGTRGTDHGAAAPVFLAGGKVRPGPHRPHPALDDLDRGDLKHHTDFRRVYATLLQSWLGLDPAPILGPAHTPLPDLLS